MTRATMNGRVWSVFALITIGTVGYFSLRAQPGSHLGSLQPVRHTPYQAARAHLASSYGKLPLSFIANRGQLDRRVTYYVPGRDKSLYFTASGVTFALAGRTNDRRRTTNDQRRLMNAGEGRPVLMPASFTAGPHLLSPNPRSEIRDPKSD